MYAIRSYYELSKLDDLTLLKGRDVSMGGMVTNVRKATTKKGNPYAILTLEDFTGSFEFAFFGSDFTEYIAYLETGFFLMIKGRVQEKRYSQDELEVKINLV